jgi:biopolymer transport protein TolR
MRKKHRPVSSINVTPMVDVMLVLLIVFMVTAPLLTVGVPVNLPKVEANSLDAQKEPLEISINENNDIYLGEELIPFEELILKVKTIAGSNTDIRIFLRADTTINYGEVMKVLGALNTSGFFKNCSRYEKTKLVVYYYNIESFQKFNLIH